MKRHRVLLVDDEIGITRTLALYLEEAGGCDVRIETHGSRALITAREFRPHLILMDLVMPDSDGATVAADIQSDPVLHGTPIVFLSALTSQRDTGQALSRIDGHPFLAKPVDPDTVLAFIEKYASSEDLP
ncbi:MAG TPA: response regulator [Vicinamibacterales bacterium]|jgi:two-component system OmpR family response regulator